MKKQLATEKGFVFNDETGKLESYEFVTAEFSFANNTIVYHCKLGGKDAEIHDGGLRVYASTEKYEQGIEAMTYTIHDYMFRALNVNTSTRTAWVFENGEAVEKSVDDMVFVLDSKNKLSIKDGIELHKTREEVFKHNDYVMVDEQGVEHVVESISTKMRMTDAQMVAIQNLKDAIDTLHRNNIRLYYGIEYEQLIAFNHNNADDSYIGYAPDMEEGFQSVYDFHETIASMGYIGCDDTLGMKFKK
jgi:hypothetical protein